MDVFLAPSPRPLLNGRGLMVALVGLALVCIGTMGFAGYQLLAGSLTDATADNATAREIIRLTDSTIPRLDQELDRQRLAVVRRNLESFAIAAEAWFDAHPNASVVRDAELRGWAEMPLSLMPVMSESYAELIVPRGWSELAIRLPDGRRIRFSRPSGWRRSGS